MRSTGELARSRLDVALVERGLCASREKAQRAVLAGTIRINQQLARKPSEWVRPADAVTVDVPERYVSRGGFKLEHALRWFGLEVTGWTALDLGASTGGFTDCLLQHGAARVCAVDVGRGQLAWKLRQDPRVLVRERTNARRLTPAQLPPAFAVVDLVVIDCSFISLKIILPPTLAFLRPTGKIIALIKPQFEAGKAEADRGGGVITEPRIHQRVVDDLERFVGQCPGLRWRGVTPSPLLGPAGNKEFLALLERVDD